MVDPGRATPRGLRADAERNRARLVEAAEVLFAERGPSVGLHAIAERAGVGVGTAYRHFPDKDELLDEVLAGHLEQYVALAEAGLHHPDPWVGLRTTVEDLAGLQSVNRGLNRLIMGEGREGARVTASRARIEPALTAVLERAQDAGVVRLDVTVGDLVTLRLLAIVAQDATDEDHPGHWRRVLRLLLDGLRSDRVPPTELGAPPLDLDVLRRAAWPT